MSFKQTIRGVLQEVGELTFVGKNETPKQSIVVFQYGYVAPDGQKKSNDELWQFNMIGKTVENLNIHENWISKIVECDVYFSGNSFPKQDGSMAYGVNCNLVAIREVKAPGVSQNTTNNTVSEPQEKQDHNNSPGQDDDLPF